MKSYVPVFIGVRVEGGVLPTVSQRAFEGILIYTCYWSSSRVNSIRECYQSNGALVTKTVNLIDKI